MKSICKRKKNVKKDSPNCDDHHREKFRSFEEEVSGQFPLKQGVPPGCFSVSTRANCFR